MSVENQRGSDRRLFERFEAPYPAKFKDTREDFGTNVYLCNASARGARFLTREKLHVYDRVALEVNLPDQKTPDAIVLKGEVVWIRNKEPELWDVGMCFPKVNFIQMNRIYELAEKSAASFSE